jgi:SAM-dependent methyltransferase
VADKVVFLGQLSNESVRQEMAAADVFVLTSVTAANGDQEGVPVSLIEAQAIGLPVVSSWHAGIPELVAHKESGFLAEERNIDEIAGYLRVLIKNPSIRKDFSLNARQRVLKEFDLAKLNDNLVEHLLRRTSGRERTDAQKDDSTTSTSDKKPHPNAAYCPICRNNFAQFRAFGKSPRPNALCPGCTSLERHRSLWLFLERHTEFFSTSHLRMLHFAPEICLERRFRQVMGKRYVTADLLDPKVDVRADITNLQFPDASFDAIYCSHVLEHVPDDHAAMQELFRVLDKNGLAIIMVPLRGATTEEDLTITDPEERTRRYGQADHVRYYGMDIVGRLEDVGFEVQSIDTSNVFTAKDIATMHLGRVHIFLCRKPGSVKNPDAHRPDTSRKTGGGPHSGALPRNYALRPGTGPRTKPLTELAGECIRPLCATSTPWCAAMSWMVHGQGLKCGCRHWFKEATFHAAYPLAAATHPKNCNCYGKE